MGNPGSIVCGLSAAGLVLGAAVSALAQSTDFVPLGDLPGGIYSSAGLDISADGSAVVGQGSSASGYEAYRWTSISGMVGLGDLPGGAFNSEAMGVSADGTVVVGQSSSTNGIEAFRWTSGAGIAGLGFLQGGSAFSQAYDVSDDGSVIVGGSEGIGGFEAFRWTTGTGMVGLGDLPGGGFSSLAYGVSADGSVIVGQGSSTNGTEAFRWTSGAGMVGLGDLPGGVFQSFAYDVAADGLTVVGLSRTTLGSEAFRWTESTGMVGLGDLVGGSFGSAAYGVSADGSVIVGWSIGTNGNNAFRWTLPSGIESVAALLSEGGTDLTGWSLTTAQGVSDDGMVIVGIGDNLDGHPEAWLARIGSGLITPEAVYKSAMSLSGVTDAIDYAAHDASSGLLGLSWNDGCLPTIGEDVQQPLCYFAVGSGSLLTDDPSDRMSGALTAGVGWRGENGFRVGAGPLVVGGQGDLSGGGDTSFYGFGGGAFAAYGDPNAGLQLAISGALFHLDADIDRAYMNGAGTDMSSGSTDGFGGSAEIQFGWRFAAGEETSLAPFANLRASYVEVDGYTETGGGFPAEIDSFDTARTTIRLGLESRIGLSEVSELVASAAWGHQLSEDNSDISGTVIGLFDFSAPNAGTYEDFVELALGTNWVNNGTRVSTTIGAAIPTSGDGTSIFGRVAVSN